MCGLAGVGVCGLAGVCVCGLAGVGMWTSWDGCVWTSWWMWTIVLVGVVIYYSSTLDNRMIGMT